MHSITKRPSLVLYDPTSGLGFIRRSPPVGNLGRPKILLAITSGASDHSAHDSSEMSTTDATPCFSRRKSAAAMPPAIVMPPGRSPYAALGPIGYSSASGV